MGLSKGEVRKDAIQQGADAALHALGNLAAIAVDAARRVTHEVGQFSTEIYEIREAARKARQDNGLLEEPEVIQAESTDDAEK